MISGMDGRNRRIADVADRGLGRLNWADTERTWIASGRTGVGAIGFVPVWARSGLYRTFGTDRYSLRDSAWITQAMRSVCGSKHSATAPRRDFLRQPGLSQAIETI